MTLPGLHPIRESVGLSQAKLAKLSGVSERSIGNYEANGLGCHATTLQALCAALTCRMEDLLEKPDESRIAEIRVLWFRAQTEKAEAEAKRLSATA